MDKKKIFYTIAGLLAIVYMLILFLYPLGKVAITSVLQNGEFSFKNYISVFTKALYLKVLFKTLWVSIISTFLALVVGYCLAYFIVTRKAKSRGLWLMLIISPMFMSLTIRLFGWMIFLSDSGPLSKLISAISTFNNVSFLFSTVAVVIGIVHYIVPFVVINIYTSLNKLEPSVLEASRMLGASKMRTFWKIIFPLSLPGVFSGSSIAFALSASTFLVPVMLGGPSDNLLSNLAYSSIVTIGNISIGATLSIILLVIVVIVLSVLSSFERRGQVV